MLNSTLKIFEGGGGGGAGPPPRPQAARSRPPGVVAALYSAGAASNEVKPWRCARASLPAAAYSLAAGPLKPRKGVAIWLSRRLRAPRTGTSLGRDAERAPQVRARAPTQQMQGGGLWGPPPRSAPTAGSAASARWRAAGAPRSAPTAGSEGTTAPSAAGGHVRARPAAQEVQGGVRRPGPVRPPEAEAQLQALQAREAQPSPRTAWRSAVAICSLSPSPR